MRVLVTGGSGRVGRWAIRELVGNGHDVVNADRVPWPAADPPETGALRGVTYVPLDLTDVAPVQAALAGCEAVVHLAAYPSPEGRPAEETFSHNTQATFVVLQAAYQAGIRRAVIASSVSALGMAYATHLFAPLYAPVDEAHPFMGQDPYALSKEVDESTAQMFHRLAGMDIAALRFHFVALPGEAAHVAAAIRHNPRQHMYNLWGYVDVRDAARACRLALESQGLGFQAYNILATNTLRTEPTEDLLRRYLPQVEIRRPLVGNETGWAIDKAQQLLGYAPQHNWQDASGA